MAMYPENSGEALLKIQKQKRLTPGALSPPFTMRVLNSASGHPTLPPVTLHQKFRAKRHGMRQ
jgi:hypothetical protein